MVEKPLEKEGGTATWHRRARGRAIATEMELARKNDLKERDMIPREESKENTEGKNPSGYGGTSQGRRGIENPNRGTTYPVQRHSTQHKTVHNLRRSCTCPFFVVIPVP